MVDLYLWPTWSSLQISKQCFQAAQLSRRYCLQMIKITKYEYMLQLPRSFPLGSLAQLLLSLPTLGCKQNELNFLCVAEKCVAVRMGLTGNEAEINLARAWFEK